MNKHWFKKTAIAGIVIASLAQSAWAAGLHAQVNSGTVAAGDRFQLTLTAEDTAAAEPDLSPLTKDFQILGTSRSSQTQVINGRHSARKSWIITLSPKKKGEINIPVIEAGALSSPAATIKVVDASEMPKSIGGTGISVTASIAPGKRYIYQEIPLKVRIETRHNLQQAALVTPESSDFELTPSGEDQSSQIMRNGQPVNVIERSYLLRPQTSGEISLPPFVLQGAVVDPNSRRDPFADMGFGRSMMRDFGMGGMFAPGKPFKVRSDAIALNVLDNPNANQDSWFLPAKQVKLEAEWVQQNPEFNVGEAVTRRISLLALGAKPEQLPELDLGQAPGVKFYVDDSATDEAQTSEGTVARRDILVSVVPTTGGEVVLPEIKVQWHDTEKNLQRTTVLAAETIRVAGSAPAIGMPAAEHTTEAGQQTGRPDTTAASTSGLSAYGREIIGGLGGLLLLGFAGFVLKRRNQSVRQRSAEAETVIKKATHIKKTIKKTHEPFPAELQANTALVQLQKALNCGDSRKIYDAILAWQLTQPKHEVPVALDAEILLLEQHLFGAAPEQDNAAIKQWNPRNFKSILKQWVEGKAEQSSQNKVLPPLYPNQKPLMS